MPDQSHRPFKVWFRLLRRHRRGYPKETVYVYWEPVGPGEINKNRERNLGIALLVTGERGMAAEIEAFRSLRLA